MEKNNKRPKGPHIVHLSTMCHLVDGSAMAAVLFFWSIGKHKLVKGYWDLASCHVPSHFVQRFQRRSKNVSTNQRLGWPSCFFDRAEQHKLGKGRWDLAFLSSFVEFRSAVSEMSKMWKDNDNERMDDGQCVIIIVTLSLRPRCTETLA